MRIDSHIFQAVIIGFTFLPALITFNLPTSIIFLIFLGLFCGAIYPDTDCPKSRIFKIKQDTSKIGWQSSYKEYKAKKDAQNMYNTFLFIYSSILVILGYLFRYLLYYPSYGIIYLMNKKWFKEDSVKDEHRGTSHTIFGTFIASLLFLILLILANIYVDSLTNSVLIIPSISFFISANIHLLQDSISKTGITWLYPFNSIKISGNYSAFTDDKRIVIFNLALSVIAISNYYLIKYINNNYPKIILVSIILSPLLFCFIAFYVLFKSCKVKIDSFSHRNS